MLPTKLAFVDIETTGARSSFDRIIEIGILLFEDGNITKTFETLVNPQTYIPPEIERLTGIHPSDVQNAPTFRQVAPEIQKLLSDTIFVAHNVRFDYGFLRSEFKRENISYSSKHFCTVRLSRILYPRFKHHNLDSIIERFDFTCERRHRALADAKILVSFYTQAKKMFSEDIFTDAVNRAMRRPSLPLNLSHIDLETLPESPGVYIFYGKEGAPLYVGKSINIKERVLSHFAGDLRSGTEMKISQQIESIETRKTTGELSALFLESHLIKKMLPLFNRQLRLSRQLIGFRIQKNNKGYDTIQLETQEEINPEDETLLGFFKSARQAKEYLIRIAKEHNLCEKLLGVEKTLTECFGYRLGRCFGACSGKEPFMKYNLRLAEAMHALKIKRWPFAGPIVIEEINQLDGTTEYIVVEKWIVLGTVITDEQGNKRYEKNDCRFDLDAYNILRRFIFSPRNEKYLHKLAHHEMSEFMQLR